MSTNRNRIKLFVALCGLYVMKKREKTLNEQRIQTNNYSLWRKKSTNVGRIVIRCQFQHLLKLHHFTKKKKTISMREKNCEKKQLIRTITSNLENQNGWNELSAWKMFCAFFDSDFWKSCEALYWEALFSEQKGRYATYNFSFSFEKIETYKRSVKRNCDFTIITITMASDILKMSKNTKFRTLFKFRTTTTSSEWFKIQFYLKMEMEMILSGSSYNLCTKVQRSWAFA